VRYDGVQGYLLVCWSEEDARTQQGAGKGEERWIATGAARLVGGSRDRQKTDRFQGKTEDLTWDSLVVPRLANSIVRQSGR